MSGHGSHKDLVALVRATIAHHRMIGPGDEVVVAVSGGPDSVALLHVLDELRNEFGWSLLVAHLDHCLRPESIQDARFVAELAEGLGLECAISRADVSAEASALGVSVEEAGRRIRYEFLEQVRSDRGASAVATGHHRDDEVETFFLRLLRGTTMTGLRGIPPVRGSIVRPLIGAFREDILHFLRARGLAYRTDCSNLGTDTDRNFIRNALLPTIGSRFAHFERPVHRTSEMLRQDEAFLSGLAAELRERAVSIGQQGAIINVAAIADAPGVVASRAILESLYALSGPHTRWSRVHVETVMGIIRGTNPSSCAHMPGGLLVARQYDKLVLTFGPSVRKQPFSVQVGGPGTVEIPTTGTSLAFQIVQAGREATCLPADDRSARFDARRMPFPLEVRSPSAGDRFRPWGLGGTRKLKKELIDRKIPVRLRPMIPLLVKDDQIVWIPGIRRSQAAPVKATTTRVLVVKVIEWGELRCLFTEKNREDR